MSLAPHENNPEFGWREEAKDIDYDPTVPCCFGRIAWSHADRLEKRQFLDFRDPCGAGTRREVIDCFVARQLGYIQIHEEGMAVEIRFLYASRDDYLAHRASVLAKAAE